MPADGDESVAAEKHEKVQWQAQHNEGVRDEGIPVELAESANLLGVSHLKVAHEHQGKEPEDEADGPVVEHFVKAATSLFSHF